MFFYDKSVEIQLRCVPGDLFGCAQVVPADPRRPIVSPLRRLLQGVLQAAEPPQRRPLLADLNCVMIID